MKPEWTRCTEENGGAFFRRLMFRPHGAPSPRIPLGVRSVGHYRMPPGWLEIGTKPKHFVQVFWGVSGTGSLLIGDREQTMGPGVVAICLSGMEHRYRAHDAAWEYRWWTMDGPLAPDILSGFGLTAGLYHAGPAPVPQFDALRTAVRDVSAAGETRADTLAYALLSRIGADRPTQETVHPHVARAMETIQRRWPEAGFGVTSLADSIGVHRSSLCRLFRRDMGISPIQYLLRLRVQNAMSLLKQTKLSAAEIAARCGFTDANYFSRVIHRVAGQSPRTFRRW